MWRLVLILILGASTICYGQEEEGDQARYVLKELPPLTQQSNQNQDSLSYKDFRDVMDENGSVMPFSTAVGVSNVKESLADKDDMDLNSAEGDDIALVDIAIPENEQKVQSLTSFVFA